MKQENIRFGEQIRTTREEKGWSQTDLGKRLSRGQGWVHCVETGKLTVREDLREKLADVLGLSTRKRELHLDSIPSGAHRRVTRNTKNKYPIPLFRLEDATPRAIEDWIDQSPKYEISEIRDLLRNAQGVIHQIPRLFFCEGEGKFNLKHIRGYFGRSSAGARGFADNLYQRFQCGIKDRKDSHGIILALTSIKATAHLERFGIAYFEQLKANNGLCISNKTLYAKGNVGTTEPGFLYMTFQIIPQEEDYAKMTDPREIARAIPNLLKVPGVSQLGSRVELKDTITDGFRQANVVSDTGDHELKFVWPTKPNRKCVSF